MKFDDFLKRGLVKRASKDISFSKALILNAQKDLSFLNELEVNEKSARRLTADYYDVLRIILEAIAILDGYKIYSHEAFSYFLSEKGDSVSALKFDRFRKIRNNINYYGADISVEESKEVIEDIKKLVDSLIKVYLDL
jgi:hypothetical protein